MQKKWAMWSPTDILTRSIWLFRLSGEVKIKEKDMECDYFSVSIVWKRAKLVGDYIDKPTFDSSQTIQTIFLQLQTHTVPVSSQSHGCMPGILYSH